MIDALVLEVTGIVVSGVVGPVVVSLAVRRSERLRLYLEEGERRRDELRVVLEEAGRLLGEGALNIRDAAAASRSGDPEPPELQQWTERVYLLEQRLLFRLTPDDTIIASLERVLDALADTDAVRAGSVGYELLAKRFDVAQRLFLDVSRTALATRNFM